MPPRPLYETPEQMEAAIDGYFAQCEQERRPPIMAGLALHLGFVSRQSLLDYEAKEAFSCTIKRARARIEVDRNERLVQGRGSTAGVIFDLKNNHDWRDKQEHEHSGTVDLVSRLNEARDRAQRRD